MSDADKTSGNTVNPLQPATPLVTAGTVTATVPAARALNAAGRQLPDTFPSPSLP